MKASTKQYGIMLLIAIGVVYASNNDLPLLGRTVKDAIG